MKIKRLPITLFLLFALIFLFVGCAPKTQYDDKEITKIETSWIEGFAPFPRSFQRTFDFEGKNVYDTWVADIDEDMLSEMENLDIDDYSHPKMVTAFTEEQAKTLYERIKSLGFLAWKENYITDEIICDGGSEYVTVTFADGTVKSTQIYFKDPPKYREIRDAFKEYLGVNFYLE